MNNRIGLYLLLVLLSACATAPEMHEQRFVNPLFYETLHPVSEDALETHLTPDKTTVFAKDGRTEISPCVLLKNTQDSIVLQCEHGISTNGEVDKNKNIISCRYVWDVYTYAIDKKRSNDDGISIKQTSTALDGKFWEDVYFVIKNKKL